MFELKRYPNQWHNAKFRFKQWSFGNKKKVQSVITLNELTEMLGNNPIMKKVYSIKAINHKQNALIVDIHFVLMTDTKYMYRANNIPVTQLSEVIKWVELAINTLSELKRLEAIAPFINMELRPSAQVLFLSNLKYTYQFVRHFHGYNAALGMTKNQQMRIVFWLVRLGILRPLEGGSVNSTCYPKKYRRTDPASELDEFEKEMGIMF